MWVREKEQNRCCKKFTYFFIYAAPNIPDVGELMAACFYMPQSSVIDNWWLGEKYDGVRVCWNPKSVNLYV